MYQYWLKEAPKDLNVNVIVGLCGKYCMHVCTKVQFGRRWISVVVTVCAYQHFTEIHVSVGITLLLCMYIHSTLFWAMIFCNINVECLFVCISLHGLRLNRQLLSGRTLSITPYKVRRDLRTILLIFDHFSAAAIGCQSGQISILRHFLASLCS